MGFTDGIYFMANDAVLDWAIAFLNSVRLHNPRTPMLLIPYDIRIHRLMALRRDYGFEVYEDASFAVLEELADHLVSCPSSRTRYRKFAAFWGPFERFLFLDADIIVLDNVQELFDALSDSGAGLLYGDADLDQCYHPGPFRDMMVSRYNARGINSGFWAARKGLFNLAEIQALGEQAQSFKHHFIHTDQPFLNYCLDQSGVDYHAFGDVLPDLATRHWPDPGLRREPDAYRWKGRNSPQFGRRVKVLHWAGFTSVNQILPYQRLYLEHRYLRVRDPLRRALMMNAARLWSVLQAPYWHGRKMVRLLRTAVRHRFTGRLKTP